MSRSGKKFRDVDRERNHKRQVKRGFLVIDQKKEETKIYRKKVA